MGSIACTGRYRSHDLPCHQHGRDCLLHLVLSAGTALVCAYESVSLVSGRTPSVTIVCGRHRSLAAGIVLILSVHFWRAPNVPVRR